MSHVVIAAFVTGAVLGIALSFRFARAVERFHRARIDFRTAVDNVRGLAGRIRQEGVRLVKLSAVVVGLAVFLAAIAVRANH